MAYRLPDRDNGSQNLCWLNLLSKLAKRPMDRRDEIGKLIRRQLMMTDVASNNPRREKRVIDSGFHQHCP
jgi:hypothetical protein